ncbi:MAG TPA: ribonuclease H-like domain-containing protein [Gemmata sp.]|nr:ribonuclease H-like domain-containing protein [Gemmata sp.]
MPPTEIANKPAFLVVDTESVPDGRLLAAVKYPEESLTPEDAIAKAQAEARENTWSKSDFLPVTFQVPVAVCVVRVGADFSLQSMKCLDSPHFRPREIVNHFWLGVTHYKAKLVTYNGRGFDLPLLEMAAFRYGFSARDHYLARDRYRGPIDLMDWFSNFGACRMVGGLNLLAKLLGKPGKMDTRGDQVYQMYREGKIREINDYCLCDTLDTYFVFLRTRILTGDINLDQEAELIAKARELLQTKVEEFPILQQYLHNWSEFASK